MMLSGFHPPGHRGVAVIVGVRCKMRRVRRSPPTIRFVSRRSVVVGTAVPVLGDGKMEEAAAPPWLVRRPGGGKVRIKVVRDGSCDDLARSGLRVDKAIGRVV